MSSLLHRYLQHSFWIILFCLYVLFVHGAVQMTAESVLLSHEVQTMLGSLLLLLLMVEPYAFVKKVRSVYAAIAQPAKLEKLFILLMLGRFLVYTWLFFCVIQSFFGLLIPSLWVVLPLTLVLIKEVIVLAVGSPSFYISSDKDSSVSSLWWHDVYLWAMACVGYTVIWEVLLGSMPLGVVFSLPELLGALLGFVLVYVPLWAAFIIEYWSVRRSFSEYGIWWISMGIAVMLGVLPLFG